MLKGRRPNFGSKESALDNRSFMSAMKLWLAHKCWKYLQIPIYELGHGDARARVSNLCINSKIVRYRPYMDIMSLLG